MQNRTVTGKMLRCHESWCWKIRSLSFCIERQWCQLKTIPLHQLRCALHLIIFCYFSFLLVTDQSNKLMPFLCFPSWFSFAFAFGCLCICILFETWHTILLTRFDMPFEVIWKLHLWLKKINLNMEEINDIEMGFLAGECGKRAHHIRKQFKHRPISFNHWKCTLLWKTIKNSVSFKRAVWHFLTNV